MRFAVLSNVIPGMPSGQAVILGRLLENIEPDKYVLIKNYSASSISCSRNISIYSLAEDDIFHALPSFIAFMAISLVRSRRLCSIVRTTGVDTIVACSGNPFNMPAAYIAARKCGIRLINYLFDDYKEQWASSKYKVFAAIIEKHVIKAASCNIVTNSFMKAAYLSRYICELEIVPNPYSPEWVRCAPLNDWNNIPAKRTIYYGGSLYHVNRDAFLCMSQALDILGSGWNMHIATSQSLDSLLLHGLSFKYDAVHPHMDSSSIIGAIQKAHLLYLPLGFSDATKGVVKTALPAKFGEYLVSGKPMIVHAPSYSYVADYVTRNDCSFVVDTLDPVTLAKAIIRIESDYSVVRRKVTNAIASGIRDFTPIVARERFVDVINR